MASPAKLGSKTIWDELAQRGIQAVVGEMGSKECVETTERYGTHNYHPLPVAIAGGRGPWVQDADGREYIDCVGSYSAMALGHLYEPVARAAREQLSSLTLTSRAVYTREMALFLKCLCEYTGMDMACPMNAGTEAVETAIKIARKWAYTVKGVPDGKAEIIAVENNFHGRSTTIVGFSSEEGYRAHFGPFTPGFKVVPFGDIEALQAAMNSNTAGVLFEPIQCEGGILFPPDGYLADVRKACSKHRALMILDEIQTGFCRTGKRFAWQHEDAEPDMMCLGKALGGGLLPVSAVVGRREAMGVFKPGDHGSTFGGNPLSSVVAIAAMTELETCNLAENSRLLGDRLLAGFRALNNPMIEDLRGRGLLVGLEVHDCVDTERLTSAFLQNGILTKETRHRTFRFAPPLNVDATLIDEIVQRSAQALAAVSR